MSDSPEHARSGIGTNFFFRILALIAKIELKLLASLALGLVLSVLLIQAFPARGTSWELVAHVRDCDSRIDTALASWVLQQQASGLNVALGAAAADTDLPENRGGVTYRLVYPNLTPLTLLRTLYFSDGDHPFPAALHTTCTPVAFEFGNPENTLVPSMSLWMAGWYLGIALLVGRVMWLQRRPAGLAGAGYGSAAVKTLRWAALGILTATGVVAISFAAVWAKIDFQSPQAELIRAAAHEPIILIFITVIGPFCEELLFRRWLLQDFVAANAPILGSVIVSVSFVSVHWMNGIPWTSAIIYYAILFVLSLVLCWVYLRSRSVWAAGLVHMAHNATMMALALA